MRVRSNIHTHTRFSDGRDTFEEYILEALRLGFVSIGFSDHSYNTHEDDFSMHPDRYRDYLDGINEMRQKYGDRIDIFAGIEQDALSEAPAVPLDYSIGSVHTLEFGDVRIPIDGSVNDQHRIINDYCGGDKNEFARLYYDSLLEHIKNFRPTVVGHFDLLTKHSLIDENDPKYREIAVDRIRECAKYCDVFELNTGAISRLYRTVPYPADFLIKELKALGAGIVLSSDCHSYDNLDFALELGAQFVKNAGYDEVLRFTGSGFVGEKI